MDVTESTAAETIQNLEVTAAALQNKLDLIETVLKTDSLASEDKIFDAMDILQAID
jgi:hypothetical protein